MLQQLTERRQFGFWLRLHDDFVRAQRPLEPGKMSGDMVSLLFRMLDHECRR
jgi:hypothetical protein